MQSFDTLDYLQNGNVRQQKAYQILVEHKVFEHLMIIEQRILLERGEEFRQQIIALKRQGMKTEPAFGLLLGIQNDPYQALLDFEEE